MPLLLSEANKLSEDFLVQGVIENIINESELLARLPFESVSGKSFLHTKSLTRGSASFTDPNEVIPENAPTFEQVTTNLRIVTIDVDTDKFIQQTLNDINDVRAINIAQQSLDLRETVEDRLIYGDNSVNSKEFSGLHKLLSTSTPDMDVEESAGALNLANLDTMIDRVKPGRPQWLLMSKQSRRLLTAYFGHGGVVADFSVLSAEGVMSVGRFISRYNDIPIMVSDYITGTETDADPPISTTSTNSSIFGMRLGDVRAGGVMGIQGSPGMEVEPVGTVQNKNAWRDRIKWYLALVVGSDLALAAVRGFAASTAVAA